MKKENYKQSVGFTTYGKELILDIHYCAVQIFTRKMIKEYFNKLCDLLDYCIFMLETTK